MKNLILLLAVFSTLQGVSVFASTPPKNILQQQQKVKQVKATKEGKKICHLVDKYSKQYRVDKRTIHAIIMAESNYNPHAVSRDGAIGLMQVQPRFARRKGYVNISTIEQNIKYGTGHYAGLLAKYNGNEQLALAAYNRGGSYVDRYHGKVPPSSRRYVKKIMSYKKIANYM